MISGYTVCCFELILCSFVDYLELFIYDYKSNVNYSLET